MSQPFAFTGRYESTYLRTYARMKLRSDPVYEAALEHLIPTTQPLLDVGCGIGLLPFFLRERGFDAPIVGIDSDAPKIEAARTIANACYENIELRIGDAREVFGTFRGSVALLDVVHYFTDDAQRALLAGAAASVAPGGVLVMRDCLRDGSWRYRMTVLEESFARVVRWLKVERLNFPTLELIESTLTAGGLQRVAVRPLWGRLPYNNYLLVYRRMKDLGLRT